jgi:hypothetical protein
MPFKQFVHHGRTVWAHTDNQGTHRENCLCFSCANFHMEEPEKKCPIANELYQFCVKYGMTTPVFECPNFAAEE